MAHVASSISLGPSDQQGKKLSWRANGYGAIFRAMIKTLLFMMFGLGVGAVAGCDDKPTPKKLDAPKVETPVAAPTGVQISKLQLVAYQPLPAKMESPTHPSTDDKVNLGRQLYFDNRISKGQEISCNTCHDLAKFGAEDKPVSVGHKGAKGTRNAQSVYNAAGHFAQFWDGRAADVEEQAQKPITNAIEMGMTDDKHAVAVLKSIPDYEAAFKKAFPDAKGDPVTLGNLGEAIGAFERGLVTPGRWDKFLGGDQAALTDDEKKGFLKFVEVGCPACHLGPYLGGSSFQKLGLIKPWPDLKDKGRAEVTKQKPDEFMFKVPSLRNVEKTAPYMHDGSVATLDKAVSMMALHQNGRELKDDEVASIVTFLKVLTGDPNTTPGKEYITAPALPKNGPKTPKPDKK